MILFQRKYDRARAFQKEQRKQREGKNAGRDDVEMANLLEKGDTFALILSAILTIVPVALVVLAVLAAAGYFFIVR